MNHDDAIRLMQRHADGWNAHDADALLSLMTEDCIYDASAGAAPYGERHVGHAALRTAFEAIWKAFHDARWEGAEHFAFGDRGITTWTFRGTKPDGSRIEVMGLDLLGFREGKICHKDTYRKNVLSGTR